MLIFTVYYHVGSVLCQAKPVSACTKSSLVGSMSVPIRVGVGPSVSFHAVPFPVRSRRVSVSVSWRGLPALHSYQYSSSLARFSEIIVPAGPANLARDIGSCQGSEVNLSLSMHEPSLSQNMLVLDPHHPVLAC